MTGESLTPGVIHASDNGTSIFVYSLFTQLLGVMIYLLSPFSMFVVHLHWLDAMVGQKIEGSCSSFYAISNTPGQSPFILNLLV